MGKEPRPDHFGGGTGSVALRKGDRKCWIALSFRRKSTRAPICRRRPFDRLEIIIGQGSLARTDNHERKNMHVILKLLYTSDPSALACVLWIVTTIWLASFWSIYRIDSTVNKGENEDNWSWLKIRLADKCCISLTDTWDTDPSTVFQLLTWTS